MDDPPRLAEAVEQGRHRLCRHISQRVPAQQVQLAQRLAVHRQQGHGEAGQESRLVPARHDQHFPPVDRGRRHARRELAAAQANLGRYVDLFPDEAVQLLTHVCCLVRPKLAQVEVAGRRRVVVQLRRVQKGRLPPVTRVCAQLQAILCFNMPGEGRQCGEQIIQGALAAAGHRRTHQKVGTYGTCLDQTHPRPHAHFRRLPRHIGDLLALVDQHQRLIPQVRVRLCRESSGEVRQPDAGNHRLDLSMMGRLTDWPGGPKRERTTVRRVS
ncbi:MAG: hypothetical protein GXY36_16895 [Chloroflexi bacterium]|nr:hypothetical protein [Chloroflexota bacterium]